MSENQVEQKKHEHVNDGTKIPVTVITGFLGSGKSTLMHHLLTSKEHKKRLAVINNEFGSKIGIGNELKGSMDEAACVVELFETQNGCICCGGKGDFLKILHTLIHNKDKFDYIVVETTGMADPTFAQDFFLDEELKEHLYLDGVVTVVDSKNALVQLNRPPSKSPHEALQIINESVEQICYADRIILNKSDLVSEDQLKELHEKVRSINPFAQITTSSFSKVNPDQILGIRSFDLNRVLKFDPKFLEFRPQRQHDSSISSFCFIWRRAVDISKFRRWLDETLSENSKNIFRAKGVILTNSPHRYVMQGVHTSVEIEEHSEWRDDEVKMSKLILIGKDIKPEQIVDSFQKSLGIPIKLEDELLRPGPSFLGVFVLILMVSILLYPGEIMDLVRIDLIAAVIAILIALYYHQRRNHPWNSL